MFNNKQQQRHDRLIYISINYVTDLPISRNVDPFNYDTMKTALLERFDLFNSAPFTIQRLSELLNEPKKHYCRLDKYMRALEKNILGKYLDFLTPQFPQSLTVCCQLSVQSNRDTDKWAAKTAIQSMEIH